MNDFPSETPRFWVAFGILCCAFIVAFVALTVATVRADAQEQQPQARACAPANKLIPALAEHAQERPVWEGLMRIGDQPIEFVLTQSQKGGWTLLSIQGGIACIMAAGDNAEPKIGQEI